MTVPVDLDVAAPTALPGDGTEYVTLTDSWRAEIHRAWDFSDDVLAAWRRLAQDAGDVGVFLGPGWFQSWVAAFAHEKSPLIVILKEAGEIKAILPCALTRAGGSVGFGSLTNDHTCHYDFLVEPEARPGVAAPIGRLMESLAFDQLDFGYLASDSQTLTLVRQALARLRIPAHQAEAPAAPWLALEGSWADLTAALPGRLRNSLKRCQKKAERQGHVEIDTFRSGPGLDRVLDDIFTAESNSWKGREGTAIKSDPNVERFYRALARWAMGEGLLLLHVFRLDGRPIAGSFCLRSGATVYLLKPGYDEAFAALSPGTLLQAEILRQLYEDRTVKTYNFLGANDPWKLEWTSTCSEQASIRAFNASLAGWVRYAATFGWKNMLKRSDLVTRAYAATRGHHG